MLAACAGFGSVTLMFATFDWPACKGDTSELTSPGLKCNARAVRPATIGSVARSRLVAC